jgi:transposase
MKSLERGRKVGEVAGQLGITSPETLRRWVKQAEADRGLRQAPTTEELAEIRKLREEVADQQRTIEILKAATAFMPTPRLCRRLGVVVGVVAG